MKFCLLIVSVVFFSCAPSHSNVGATKATPDYTLGGKMYSSFFQQRAAEYKALCLQAYNIAWLRIQNYVPVNDKPKALITDIDEAIMDNSPYAVHQVKEGKDYDLKSWQQWTSLAAADTMAGSVALLKKAAAAGVEIFYISNRGMAEQEGTLKNLQKFGYPNADAAHLLLKTEGSSKEPRRQKVMADHQVILFMGDNLADFSSLWDKKTEQERKDNVLNNPQWFGDKFIVLPNANYGDWEGAYFKYNYQYTPAQKDSMLRKDLRSF